MKNKYFIDPVTHNQVRESGDQTATFGGRLVWDGDREQMNLDEGMRGAELVCRLLNLGGVSELPTIPETRMNDTMNTTARYQIVHNNPEDGLSEPYFDSLGDAQREATKLVNSLPTAWFWIWDCQNKNKVQSFEKDWAGQRF